MIPDPDIYRAAKLVIDRHGDDAALSTRLPGLRPYNHASSGPRV